MTTSISVFWTGFADRNRNSYQNRTGFDDSYPSYRRWTCPSPQVRRDPSSSGVVVRRVDPRPGPSAVRVVFPVTDVDWGPLRSPDLWWGEDRLSSFYQGTCTSRQGTSFCLPVELGTPWRSDREWTVRAKGQTRTRSDESLTY